MTQVTAVHVHISCFHKGHTVFQNPAIWISKNLQCSSLLIRNKYILWSGHFFPDPVIPTILNHH